MSSYWGPSILAAAIFFGLKGGLSGRQRSVATVMVVIGAVAYAALRQHTF
ncbi:MAG: hypothetical protein ACRDYY_12815 [Acidimicrobiales bacterium]